MVGLDSFSPWQANSLQRVNITYFCTAICAMAEGDAKLPRMTVGSMGVGTTLVLRSLLHKVVGVVGIEVLPPQNSVGFI